MAIACVSATTRSAPRLAAESHAAQVVDNDLCTAVLAMAGHDMRQPLQLIMLAHDALAHRLRGPEREELGLIESAVTCLARTLDQLTDTLRLQGGTMGPALEPVPLRSILAELASELTGLADLRGVELCIMPTCLLVSSHPVLLSGILRNLLRNALEYTPRGGRVLVTCRRRGSEGHIEVRDTGAGIAAGDLTRIFTAFHRLDPTRRDGLGLGLFIVEHAARFLGHRVEVRSAAGRGSSFVVVANAARVAPKYQTVTSVTIGLNDERCTRGHDIPR